MKLSLNPWIRLNQFTVGRRLFAIAQVKRLAEGRGLSALVERCAQAEQLDKQVRELERRYKVDKNRRVDPRLQALDPQIDKLVGAIYRICVEVTASLAGELEGDAAARIVRELYPGGPIAITTLTYVDQGSEVGAIVEHLSPDGVLGAQAQTVGLVAQVARLGKLNAEFLDLLPKGTDELVRWDHVRAANAQGDERLRAIVAWILGQFPDPHQAEARAALLEPIRHQDEAIRAALSARRTVRDVDPVSGEEIVDEADPETTVAPVPESEAEAIA